MHAVFLRTQGATKFALDDFLSALGDGFPSLAIFIAPRNGLVLAAGRLSRVSEHKIHAALRGKISPHQTDQAMCAVASDMAFKVALVIKI